MDNNGIVLIVDDTVSIRETLSAILRRDHYTLLLATSGEEALALAEQHMPDVILLDVMMPGMSGFDVCRVLRQSATLAEVPVLIVTALDDRASLISGLEAGADDFLTKPIDLVELRARVRSIVRLNRYRRLLDERERFKQVADCSSDAILSVDDRGRIAFANRSARQLFGDAVDDESDAQAVIAPADRDTFAAWLRGATTGEPIEQQCRSGDGTEFTAEITAGRGSWRGAPSMTWVIRDVTERNRLRARAENAERLEAIAKSTAGLAHDFANYLTAIRMAVELLPGEPPATAERRVEVVLQQIDDATTLVRRINLFAKGGAAPVVRLNLQAVIRDLEPMLRHVTGRDCVMLDLRETPPISGDAVQIGQVVSNLVINSGHAIDDSGTIHVRTYTDGSDAVLQVEDNGCGMDEATRAKVFEPYFTTRAGRGGTGLGLSMVYGIVHKGGGSIDLESAPGRGTTFTVRWPAAT